MYRPVNSHNQALPSHLDDVIASVVSDSIAYNDDTPITQAVALQRQNSSESTGLINASIAISSYDQEKASGTSLVHHAERPDEFLVAQYQSNISSSRPGSRNITNNQLIFNSPNNTNSLNINQANQLLNSKQSPNSFWLTSSNINPGSKSQQMCISNATQLIGQFANNQSKIIQHGQNLYQVNNLHWLDSVLVELSLYRMP